MSHANVMRAAGGILLLAGMLALIWAIGLEPPRRPDSGFLEVVESLDQLSLHLEKLRATIVRLTIAGMTLLSGVIVLCAAEIVAARGR